MEDGNKAIQVGPVPTESEMNHVGDMFKRALNAIAYATELAETVKDLAKQVEALKADIEQVRRRNADLDDMIQHLRSERDKARDELAQTRSDLWTAATERDKAKAQNDADATLIGQLREDLAKARQEASDNGSLAASYSTEADKWKAKAEQAHGKLSDLVSLFAPEPSKPEPVPQSPADYPPPAHDDGPSHEVHPWDRPADTAHYPDKPYLA